MTKLMLLGVAFVMGTLTSIYLPMNSAVAKYVGSSVLANLPFFVLATLTTIGIAAFSGDLSGSEKLKDVPWPLYLGGFISAVMVLGSTLLIPQLGAGSFFILFVGGQVLMAMVISHFGLIGAAPDPITLRKLLGAMLVLAGIALATTK